MSQDAFSCGNCGTSFTPNKYSRGIQKYCCGHCQSEAYKGRESVYNRRRRERYATDKAYRERRKREAKRRT